MKSKSNNEVYNIKEVLQQPDKDKFIEAMNQEESSMFKEGIWTLVPKKEMLDYYAREREKGVNIKRQQLMMIWSFKRKGTPKGISLNTKQGCVAMVDNSNGELIIGIHKHGWFPCLQLGYL